MDFRDDATYQGVTDALREWRQGDCVVGNEWFLYRSNPANPLTPAGALSTDSSDIDSQEVEVPGFMVVTQTCDIVRDSKKRPFVAVSPLREVDDESLLDNIKRGERPNYAFIPGLAEKQLVVDLDRVMTVEKSVVANWGRVPGYLTDDDKDRLSLALVRNRARFAFPDDFTRCVEPLRQRILSKHKSRKSDEGRALQSLREIRVHAAPSWEDNEEEIELNFLFIRKDEEPDFEQQGWNDHLEKWLSLVRLGDRFVSVDGDIMPLEALTAKEYVESKRLDLDHLSTRGE